MTILANPNQEKLYEVPLDGGEVVFVRPLSPYARFLFREQAIAVYPEPNERDYQHRVENSPVELYAFTAEQEAVYKEAMKEAQSRRANHMYRAVLFSGVIVDTPEGSEATLARYAAQLEQMRRFGNLPSDDWLACCVCCLVTTGDDVVRIYSAASEALTEEEIRAGVRLFRRPVQRNRFAENPGREAAPGAAP